MFKAGRRPRILRQADIAGNVGAGGSGERRKRKNTRPISSETRRANAAKRRQISRLLSNTQRLKDLIRLQRFKFVYLPEAERKGNRDLANLRREYSTLLKNLGLPAEVTESKIREEMRYAESEIQSMKLVVPKRFWPKR